MLLRRIFSKPARSCLEPGPQPAPLLINHHKQVDCKVQQDLQRKQHGRLSTICRSASGEASEVVKTQASRSAVLHDFCMIIPYSLAVIVLSLISIPFGNGWKGLHLAFVGGLEMFVTIRSLKRWQARVQHIPLTAASAGLAGLLTWQYWGTAALRQGFAYWLNQGLAVLSGAAFLFLVYNIWAGGNPPKQENSNLDTEPQSAPGPVQ